jgi:hypothetical protein
VGALSSDYEHIADTDEDLRLNRISDEDYDGVCVSTIRVHLAVIKSP